MRHAIGLTMLVVFAVFLGALLGSLILVATTPEPETKWRTHYETVERTIPGEATERTIPGPETTVFKKRPGVTTWIIVCGKKETTVRGNKPFSECNLSNTGP